MGAHTLGGAHREHSGYDGPWIEGEGEETTLDADYYALMISNEVDWENKNVENHRYKPAKWQMNGFNATTSKKAGFMLNTDFGMLYDLKLDAFGKLTCKLDHTCGLRKSCQVNECQKGPGFDLSVEYANNCSSWLEDFKPIYEKMLTNGNPLENMAAANCPKCGTCDCI